MARFLGLVVGTHTLVVSTQMLPYIFRSFISSLYSIPSYLHSRSSDLNRLTTAPHASPYQHQSTLYTRYMLQGYTVLSTDSNMSQQSTQFSPSSEATTLEIHSREEALHILSTALGVNDGTDPADVTPRDALYIELDMESQLSAHGQITEIGFSVLDLRTINSPGAHGSSWMNGIQNHHLRVREHSTPVRMQRDRRGFQLWNADGFQYGRSEWVSLEDVTSRMTDILRVPDDRAPGTYRDVILAAHAWSNEAKALWHLGFSVEALGTVRFIVDTAAMATKPGRQRPGLHGLLMEAGIHGEGLHNAGNDAVLQKFVVLREVLSECRPEALDDHPTISPQSVLDALKAKLSSAPSRAFCNICGADSHHEEACRELCCGCHRKGHSRLRCNKSAPFVAPPVPQRSRPLPPSGPPRAFQQEDYPSLAPARARPKDLRRVDSVAALDWGLPASAGPASPAPPAQPAQSAQMGAKGRGKKGKKWAALDLAG